MLISIIVPCYYSKDTIGKVVEMTAEEFARHEGFECEFVLVNDGSTDGTFSQIKALAEKHENVKGINLLRNFGQHNALMAALHYIEGDYVLAMDDDMQTHPSQIFKLIEKIQEGYDIVFAHYAVRQTSGAKKLSHALNDLSSRILLGRPKDVTTSNFWIITSQVAREAAKYNGFSPYTDGVFFQITHNVGNVEVEHHKREVGSSNYTFKKLVRLWLAYWNYSVVPLRIASVAGGCAALVGFVAVLITVVRKLVDPTLMLGWASTMCVVMLFAGMILMCLGIMGEYLGKIILTLNHTPQFIVRETVNVDNNLDEGHGESWR